MSLVAETATLVHGYSMADVERIARVAVRKHFRSWGVADEQSRLEVAWDAVVVRLYSSALDPEFVGLLRAGLSALDYFVVEERHHHGLRNDTIEPGPNFIKYWLPLRAGNRYDDGFSDRLCETLSLPTALAVLTVNQYEALVTLAAFNNNSPAAADYLGLTEDQFRKRVYRARAAITAVWFEGETPARLHASGETCRSGHDRSEHGVLRSSGRWECRLCARNQARRKMADPQTRALHAQRQREYRARKRSRQV